MKCPECRAAALTTRRENYRYDESGLPNVVLVDIEVRHCPKCAAELVSIPRMELLHRAIALALISKAERLAPAEVRFLRKSLGWSQVDFARAMHVAPETANRWESDKSDKPMEGGYELALRLAVAQGEHMEDYDVQKLADIAQGERRASRIVMTPSARGWSTEVQP